MPSERREPVDAVTAIVAPTDTEFVTHVAGAGPRAHIIVRAISDTHATARDHLVSATYTTGINAPTDTELITDVAGADFRAHIVVRAIGDTHAIARNQLVAAIDAYGINA